MLYYKIHIGFNDFILIDQDDYAKAIRAQVTGKVAILKNGETISGNLIGRVSPDWEKMTGFDLKKNFPHYQDEVEKVKKIRKEHEEFIKTANLELPSQPEIKKLT